MNLKLNKDCIKTNGKIIRLWPKTLLCALMSMWSAFSFVFLFTDFESYSQFVPIVSVGVFLVGRKLYEYVNGKVAGISVRLMGAAISVLLSASLVLSAGVERCFELYFSSVKTILLFVLSVLGVSALVWWLLMAFVDVAVKREVQRFDSPSDIKTFFIIWVAMFSGWLVLYLCYYPGIITGDTIMQLGMVDGKSGWTNHHPVLHTFLIGVLMKAANHHPALYMICQMLIMTGVFSFCCYYLRNKNIWKWLWYATVAYFIFHPIHAYSGFTMVKDTLFSGFVLLFSICLCEIVLTRGECLKKMTFIFLFFFSALMVLFFRNNGFLIIIISMLAALVLVKKFKIRMFATFSLSLVLYFAATGLLYPALGIEQGSIAESLAIPIQQIARVVYENKELEPQIMSYIDSILPIEDIKASYVPTTVDVLKFHENFNIEIISADIAGFLKVWASILVKYPLTYVKAYLMQTECLWDLGTHAGLIENFHNSTTYVDLRMTPFFEPLSGYIRKLIDISQFSSFAFITTPFWNIAICYVVVCVSSIVCIAKKEKDKVLVAVPVIAVWLSLALAIPAALVGRYSYSVFTCLPLIIGVVSIDRRGISRSR